MVKTTTTKMQIALSSNSGGFWLLRWDLTTFCTRGVGEGVDAVWTVEDRGVGLGESISMVWVVETASPNINVCDPGALPSVASGEGITWDCEAMSQICASGCVIWLLGGALCMDWWEGMWVCACVSGWVDTECDSPSEDDEPKRSCAGGSGSRFRFVVSQIGHVHSLDLKKTAWIRLYGL